MNNVTEYFEKYREASRHLRNIYYIPSAKDDWDKLDDFEELNVMLFKHLVCTPLNIGLSDHDWLCEPTSIFRLKAQSIRLPIMINRKPGVDHGYWDHEISCVEHSDLELVFMSYFDWNRQGVIDHRYILCRILDARESKCVIGHTALVESQYVEIHHKVTADKVFQDDH